MKPPAALKAARTPAQPSKIKPVEYWIKKGITKELVEKAATSKNKKTALDILKITTANRYLLLPEIYKSFRIRENYSGKDKFAERFSDTYSPDQLIETFKNDCNTREFSTA